jgi:CubicO group peptidase (beta-lactamase class C family)
VPFVFGYALGWMTTRDLDLRHVYMHFGAGSGTTAWMGVFPDQRVVVAVLANLGHADFTYASTLGVGARFASRPLLAPIVVLLMVFSAFFALTYAVAWTILRTRR